MNYAERHLSQTRRRLRSPGPAASLLAVLLVACAEPHLAEDELASADPAAQAVPADTIGEVLRRALARADSVEELLFPAPLMTPQEEASLRTASNDAQLARARQLGVRVTDQATMQRLVAEGRLVPLEEQTQLWTTRRLRSSLPYVTPDARALLVRIGERFQQKLGAMDLPRLRVEVTSVLRTPEDQAALRQTNPNASAGVSTHEFGTTFDLAYSGYAAPGGPSDAAVDDAARVGALALERVAARYSRELQKVLGDVLRELQAEGLVMVTLERQQPVYHLTVARALAGRE
jgi:hypothetical protein